MYTNEYDTYLKEKYPDAKPGDLFRIIRENQHHPPHRIAPGSLVKLHMDDETGWPLFVVVLGVPVHPDNPDVSDLCVGIEVLAVEPLTQEP